MAEERWQVTVRVPMGLPQWQQEELFDRIAATVSEWEPEQRDGWDADVAAGPAGEEAMLPAVFGYEAGSRDIELLLWLHAEAVWERHQANLEIEQVDGAWRAVVAMWEQGHQNDVLPYTAKLEDEIAALNVAVAEERASRQAWAEEAIKMETIADRVLTFYSQHDERLAFISRRCQQNERRNRCRGISADALAWFAVGRRGEPKSGEYPVDPTDLAACQRTFDMAPGFLQERMAPVLDRYRAAIAEDYPEVEAGFTRPQCTVHPEQAAALGPDHPAGSPEGYFRPDPQMGQQQAESTSVHPENGGA